MEKLYKINVECRCGLSGCTYNVCVCPLTAGWIVFGQHGPCPCSLCKHDFEDLPCEREGLQIEELDNWPLADDPTMGHPEA